MEYIRVFNSAADAEEQLAQITHPTLSAIRGGGFIGLRQAAPPPPVTVHTPFFVEDTSGSDNTLQIRKTHTNCPSLTIYMSLDGKSWETMGTTSTTAITATVPANGRLYLRCSTTHWGYERENYEYTYKECNRISCTGDFNVGGNIMSLLYGSDFTGNEIAFNSSRTFIFTTLFKDSKIMSAAELFLPATTLKGGCYNGMFQNCTSLTTAPTLPASDLVSECYNFLFDGCSSLNYIKCLATSSNLSYYTQFWCRGVGSTGTFVKDAGVTWTTGQGGIPEGWTVEDAA